MKVDETVASTHSSGLVESTSNPAWRSDTYPAIVNVAERLASSSQSRYFWTTRADLLLLVGAASMIVFFVLAEERLWDTDRWPNQLMRLAMPLLLGGSFVAKILNRKRNVESMWIRSRAVAERAKSLSWRYVMSVSPFAAELGGDDAESAFELRISELADALPANKTVTKSVSREDVLETEHMRDLRRLGSVERRQVYVRDRLDDQVEWYARRAARSKKSARRWYQLSVVVKALTLVAAICAVFWLPSAAFVGFGTTLGASALAASKLGRHEEVQRRYAQAGSELSLVRPKIATAESDDELAAAIAAAEDIISREHAIWVGQL